MKTETVSGLTAGVARVLAAVAVVGVLGAGCSAKSADPGSATATTAKPGDPTPTATSPTGRPVLGPKDETGEPQRGGELVFGLEAEPGGLDPSRSAFEASSHLVASAVFDPLVTLDDQGKPVPYLVESITPNAAYTEWVITLKDGVLFHDGTKLDAEALRINFDYWSKSFVTQAALSSMDSFAVVDPMHLKVTTKQPWTSFPYTLSTQTSYVAAPSFLQNPDPEGPSMHPVGTGPFKFKDYQKGKSFTAERFDGYWQKGLPYLDQIRFEFLPDALSRLASLTKGDVDVLHAYQPEVVAKAEEAAARNELKAVENGDGEEDVVSINTEKAPFDDIGARQALAYATDAAKWRELTESGARLPVHSPFAQGQLGFSDDTAYPEFDLTKAKKLADEYKAKHGTAITAELLTTENVDDKAQAQLLVDQWAQAGMNITIKSVELSGLVIQTVLGDYQLVGWRNFGSPDPDGDYLWWHSSAVLPSPRVSTNVARLKDDAIDKALDEARGSNDAGVRAKAYQTVAKRLNENVAYVWLGRPTWVFAANPDVQGLGGAANGTGATLGAKTWIHKLWLKR